MTVPAEEGLRTSGGAAPLTWPHRVWQTFGTHALALADQAVVSGTSFLATVLIGRWSDASELGVYALAISILASTLAVQDSLVSLPFAIQRLNEKGVPEDRAGRALTHSVLLSVLAAVVLMGVALYLGLGHGGSGQAMVMWALATVMPFALLREFGRSFAFARLSMGEALTLDVAVAVIQLGTLCLLGWSGPVSAVTALAALGGACAVSGMIWFLLTRRSFAVRAGLTRASMAESFKLGKWLLAGRLTVQVQWYVTYWLSMIVLGAAATGVYAACMSVVAISNPLISGLNNILTPRAVLAWKSEGSTGLRRQAVWDALFLGAAMSCFSVLLFAAGDGMMHLLFKGQDYAGQGHTVTVLALALLAQAVGTPASSALANMERPHAIVWAGLFAAVVTVPLVWFLMMKAGLLGAAYGFLVGNIAGAAGRWLAFLAIAPARADDQIPAIAVLEQLTKQPIGNSYSTSQLGEGEHATVVAIRSNTDQPVWRENQSLIVKLYKLEASVSGREVQAQFDVLARLHASVHGQAVDGWHISVPEPLALCQRPLALVMTEVHGRNLYSWTASGDCFDRAGLDEVARVTFGAIKQCWDHNVMHGDFALQNILCDFEGKRLGFVDGGTERCCVTCHGCRQQWPAATLDLAHIMSDVLTDIKKTLVNKPARSRRYLFAESMVRAYLAEPANGQPARARLEAIRLCTLAHLEDLLKPSWSPRGVWCRLLKHTAQRRLDALLGRLYAGIDGPGNAAPAN